MIIKNGTQVEITEKDLKKLLVEKGFMEADEKGSIKDISYPLVFKLVDKRPYIWWDTVNKKRRSPRAVGISCEVKINEKGNIITYRYADTFIPKDAQNRGRDSFTPNNINFLDGHPIVCGKNDVEKAFILLQSDKINGADACFYLENKKQEAKTIVDKEYLDYQAKNILYKDLKDQTSRKRDIASAMGFHNTDKLDDVEVTAILAGEIKKDADKFIKYTEGQHMIVRAKVRQANDAGVFMYDSKGRTWHWVREGKKGDLICNVLPTVNADEALCNYFSEHHKEFDILENQLLVEA